MPDATTGRFDEDGFQIARGLFNPDEDFAPVLKVYDRKLDELGAPGSALPMCSDRIAARTAALYANTSSLFSQHFDVTLPPRANLPADIPICLDAELFHLFTHPKLLDVVETFIGPEIDLNPVNHVRIKPPQALMESAGSQQYAEFNVNNRNGMMAATPLHQDNAVFTEDADDVDILTVWFPITDAPIEKGCLHVIPGSHKQGLRDHCPSTTSDLQIPNALTPEDPVPLPMRAGDVLFLNKRTVHGSLPNLSDTARWSFDLRYQTAGKPNGRDVLPSFTVRSRAAPRTVTADAKVWARAWLDARTRLSALAEPPRTNRWSSDAPMCA